MVYVGLLVWGWESGYGGAEEWDIGYLGCKADVEFESTEFTADNEDTAGIGVYQLCGCVPGWPAYSNVSCIVLPWFLMLMSRASQDNIRLWNTVEYYDPEESIKKSKSRPPFKIVAGHHGGTISSMSKSYAVVHNQALTISCRSYL